MNNEPRIDYPKLPSNRKTSIPEMNRTAALLDEGPSLVLSFTNVLDAVAMGRERDETTEYDFVTGEDR